MKLGKKVLSLIMVGGLMLTLGACSAKKPVVDSSTTGNQQIEKPEKLPMATIEIKDFGTIEAELYPHIAPITVENFTKLANEGFYDGLTFHRIIKDFMIQGGDPNGDGTGGPGYTIKGEFSSNGVKNDIKHTDGVLSMARTNKPDTAGSQFFIMTAPAPHLDGEYAAFGMVTKGLELLDKLESVETGENDKPKTSVVIEKIRVTE